MRSGGRVSASRRAFWVRSGLLGLVVFALLAFTLHSLRLSDASFTTASSNTSNVFISGSLGHTNNLDHTVTFTTLAGMKPGSSRSAPMNLTGTPSLAGDYTLSVENIKRTPPTSAIADVVYLRLTTASGTELCDDPIGDFDPVELGSIAPGQTNSYTVTIYYNPEVINGAAQGGTLTATVRIQGVSQ
jgi:hypothetical protein